MLKWNGKHVIWDNVNGINKKYFAIKRKNIKKMVEKREAPFDDKIQTSLKVMQFFKMKVLTWNLNSITSDDVVNEQLSFILALKIKVQKHGDFGTE